MKRIATGSSLGPTMANIFVFFFCLFEQDLLPHFEEPTYYVSYINETFCVFENEVEIFYQSLNTLHQAHKKRRIMVFFLSMLWYTDQIQNFLRQSQGS